MEHASINPSLASILDRSDRSGRKLSVTNSKQREQAIGNCYLYWGANGDLELVRHAICDRDVGWALPARPTS